MYDGNPGEIDFGSSWREVRVSEGSSYRESTVYVRRGLMIAISGFKTSRKKRLIQVNRN